VAQNAGFCCGHQPAHPFVQDPAERLKSLGDLLLDSLHGSRLCQRDRKCSTYFLTISSLSSYIQESGCHGSQNENCCSSEAALDTHSPKADTGTRGTQTAVGPAGATGGFPRTLSTKGNMFYGAPCRGGVGSQIINAGIPSAQTAEEVLADWYNGSGTDSWTKFVPAATAKHYVDVKNVDGTMNPLVAIYDKNLNAVACGTGVNGQLTLGWSATAGQAYFIVASNYQVGLASLTIRNANTPQCATPQVTPDKSGSPITLQTATVEATIIYRVNSQAWLKYTQPVKVPATGIVEIWAKALKDGYRESGLAYYATA